MTTTTEVPGRLPVAVNGHPYLADPVTRETVPVIRQQADTSTEAGEQTLNPQGLWRRSQESWHHGAGQTFLDGRQGDQPPDPHRFRSSAGVDCWTKGQISLLHPTLKVFSSSSSNLKLASVTAAVGPPGALVVAAGTELYSSVIPFMGISSFATQTGTGWTATNATVTASTSSPAYAKVTATASAAVTATTPTGTSGVPVDGGRRYGFAFQSVNISGAGGQQTPTVAVNWYDSGGVLISSTTPVVATDDDAVGGVTVLSDAIAPSNAVYASLTGAYTANWTNGDVHNMIFVIGPYDDMEILRIPDAWNPVNINGGQPAQTVQSITTDGTNIWVALGTSGLHRWTYGGGSATVDVPAAPASGQVSLVGYANGFLLAAGSAGTTATLQNTLWLVETPLGASTLTAIKTHPNTGFVWTGIGPGRSCVYAWGNSGGNGEVYKILFDPNTGSLSTAASFATYLPDGETIHALQFYAGGIIMGTGKGVRIGTADGSGNIDYGPLIPTLWPVRCLEPQDRYCWFGWTKYDTTHSGLGRIDLGFLTDTLTPAWASDLMPPSASSGDVTSAITFAPYGYSVNQRPPVRVFAVAGAGVFIEDQGSRVASASLDTGAIRFSTSEPKTARSVDVRHHTLPDGATIDVEMQRDSSGTWEALGTSSTAGSYGPGAPLDALNETAEALEFRFTMTRPDPAGTDFTASPEMTRWTAKVLPTPSTIDESFTIPIIMRTEVLTNTGDGVPYRINVPAEVAYLKGLEQSRDIIDIQIGDETITNCYVAGSHFEPDTWKNSRKHQEGIFTLTVTTARG